MCKSQTSTVIFGVFLSFDMFAVNIKFSSVGGVKLGPYGPVLRNVTTKRFSGTVLERAE